MPKRNEPSLHAAIASFARQVRRRSQEHSQAVDLLAREGLVAPSVAILRQEVDSLIRVIFMLAQPPAYREALVRTSIKGERWRRLNNRSVVTDREMVELSVELIGWTRSVYKFGCAFVHLSNLHDYDVTDPLAKLPEGEREDILQHMRYYHGGPQSDRPNLSDLVPFIPMVLKKISDNLDHYLEQLESGLYPQAEAI